MKTRILKTGIYTDEVMFALTPDVRFICVYLYTNSHIGLTNIYKIPVQLIQLETGYDISVIRLALDRLQEVGVVEHYKHLWVKLLKADFASLDYSGGKNDVAISKYEQEIPLEIRTFFSQDSTIDTTMDGTIHSTYKSETINNKPKTENKEPEIEVVLQGESSKDIVKILDLFSGLNPAVKTMYGNKTQRKACSELLQRYDLEEIEKMITTILPVTNKKEYYPIINTPYELNIKFQTLIDRIHQDKSKNKAKEETVIINGVIMKKPL